MPYRIGVLGLGGVGGYVGGMLAARYASSSDIEAVFIVRGANQLAMRSRGLRVVLPSGEVTARPAVISASTAEIGRLDLLIAATKSYDLEEGIAALRGSIAPETIILSLQNGIDLAGRIHRVYPQNPAWEGCVYIIAELSEPGVVRVTSKQPRMLFGSVPPDRERQERVSAMLMSAGVDFQVAPDIQRAMWEKFFLITPLATLTSYLDKTGDVIMADPKLAAMLEGLLNELMAVARAKNVNVAEDIVTRTLGTIASFPAGSMTSMHRDFRNRRRTEMEALTGYVVRIGKELGVTTPGYAAMMEALEKRV